MKLNLKFLFLILLSLASCSKSSFNEDAAKKLSEYVDQRKSISAAYVVDHGNQIIFEGSNGFFNREKQIPLEKNQKMPIASGTKQMTAALILRLQERGTLTVKDTISKFLPAESGWWPNNQMPEWASKITIHQLLTHTSGLAEYIPAYKFNINQTHDKIKHDIAAYAANTALTHEPGEKYAYTNTGYFFLGLILENIFKDDIASIFKKEIFDPLDMKDSHMASLEEAVSFQNDSLENYPYRYFAIPTGAEPQFMPAKVDFYLVPFSDGGVVSTPADLVKWNKAFHSGIVVSDYSYKLMTTPYNDAHDLILKDVKIGYGVYIAKLSNGQTAYYHSGRAVGIRCEHGYIPESKLYFALLSNVMIYETPEMEGKVDYTIPANQFDISYFRSAIWDLVQNTNSK